MVKFGKRKIAKEKFCAAKKPIKFGLLMLKYSYLKIH